MATAPNNPFFEFTRSLVGFASSTLRILTTFSDWVASALSRHQLKSEREAEIARLTAHAQLADVMAANAEITAAAPFPDLDHFLDDLMTRWAHDLDNEHLQFPIYPIRVALLTSLANLYQAEGLDRTPPPPMSFANPIEEAKFRDLLTARRKKCTDPQTLATIDRVFRKILMAFSRLLPPIACDAANVTDVENEEIRNPTVSLMTFVPNPGPLLDAIVLPLFDPSAIDLDLFKSVRKQLQANADELSVEKPSDYRASPSEMIDGILGRTDFAKIFNVQVPFSLPDEQRFAGHWVVAPPGRGKTTLLHTMVLDDLAKDASIVLIDSKGDLIDPIKNLQLVRDRLVLVEPNADAAFALNPLDTSNTNVTQAVTLIEYIMAGLLDAKFTALQSTLFRNVVPAIIEAVPSPTLDTFKEVMVKGLPTLQNVSPHARQFFENRETGFYSKTYEGTRKEVVWRLDYLMSNPILRAMFSASHTKLDMGTQLDAGKVIIINNSKAILGDEGAEFFGRFFVALIARAAQQRAGKAPSAKKPCYVYIDECQSVIAKDTRIPVLLDECRSQKIALILAHQRTAQLTAPVLDAVANCAIRMANSDDEAKFLSDKLRMSADTLRSLPRGTFGTFVRDLTPQGIQLRVSKTDLDSLPKMTDGELAAIRERMRTSFSSPPPASNIEQLIAPSVVPAAAGPPARPAENNDAGEPAADWVLEKK